MSVPASSLQSVNESRPELSGWPLFFVKVALAMGGFGIGTGEFAIMGLMPTVASDLNISEPQVGHLISAYALGVVIGAPLLAILGAHLQRRFLLLLLMGFFALGNFASAVAPSYHSLMWWRFVAGLPHGAYFGVAALVAASLVPERQRAQAVSHVLAGLTLAILIGNPLATWLGQLFDWRIAFALVGSIAILTVILTLAFLPDNRHEVRSDPMTELRDFNNTHVWFSLLISAIGFAGMFCVFSYVAPTLKEVTQVGAGWVPVAMAVFGAGTILGNIIGGWMFDRFKFAAVGWLLLWSAAILFLYPFATGSIVSLLLACFAVGSMVSLSPALQTHLMDVARRAQTLAAASNHAAFNVANAIGPWIGGMAISAGLGWQSTGFLGSLTALTGLLVFLLAQRRISMERRSEAAALAVSAD